MNINYSFMSDFELATTPRTLQSFGTVKAGETLIIHIALISTAAVVNTITDTMGNTWIKGSGVDVGTSRFEFWWVPSCVAGLTTPSITFTGTSTYRYATYQVSNVTGTTLAMATQLNDTVPGPTIGGVSISPTLKSAAFAMTRLTGTFANPSDWTDGFAKTLPLVSYDPTVNAASRTEINPYTAAPALNYGTTALVTGTSHTVVIYGTPTVTRWYPTLAYPGVLMRGPAQGTWNDGADIDAWSLEQGYCEMALTKYKGGRTTFLNLATNQQGNFDFKFITLCTPPLIAANLNTLFNFCIGIHSYWDSGTSTSATLTVAQLKVHAFITTGNNPTPRTVLINNHVESTLIPQGFTSLMTSLASALPMVGTILTGDRIVIEIGIRVVSSPTPTPTYPPQANSHFKTYVFSNTVDNIATRPDGWPGMWAGNYATWVQIDQVLSPVNLTIPVNDSCAEAIEILSFPFQSGFYDATGSTDVSKAMWWKFIAPKSGHMIFHSLGSNYLVWFNIYEGVCGSLSSSRYVWADTRYAGLRNFAYKTLDVTAGTTYYVSAIQSIDNGMASDRAGTLRIGGFYQDTTPQPDDLYIHAGWLGAFRNGQLINFNPFFLTYAATGMAIDYSKKPLLDIEDETIHTSHRIYTAYHHLDGIEVFDLATLDLNSTEVGYHYYWGTGVSPAQIYLTRDGYLYTGWFGNGYLYVCGAGNLPATLNANSNNPEISAFKRIKSDRIETQEDFNSTTDAHVSFVPNAGPTSPWAFTVDETTKIIYYVTSGYYNNVGAGTDIIRRFDTVNNVQLADFATVPLQGIRNTGLKGMRLLPSGGLIIANGTVVNRLNAAGAIIQTYTPSNAADHQSTVDVELTENGKKFWMYDLYTSRATQFDLNTGAEITSFMTYFQIGTSVQIAVYRPTLPLPDGGGILFINPKKATQRDTYYGAANNERKIPNPTLKSALLGE